MHLYSKQNMLDMMDAAEDAYRGEAPETPFYYDSVNRYMREKILKMMEAAERKAEERSATRYLCARPRPPPLFIPMPPPHFDLHEIDTAAHRHSPYMVTGLTASIAYRCAAKVRRAWRPVNTRTTSLTPLSPSRPRTR